jgi:hypothetical protein
VDLLESDQGGGAEHHRQVHPPRRLGEAEIAAIGDEGRPADRRDAERHAVGLIEQPRRGAARGGIDQAARQERPMRIGGTIGAQSGRRFHRARHVLKDHRRQMALRMTLEIVEREQIGEAAGRRRRAARHARHQRRRGHGLRVAHRSAVGRIHHAPSRGPAE